jgi:hypothetical protein
MGQETWQSDFVTRQCPVSHIKTGERHLEIAWMGHPSAPAVILWHDSIWLSPLRINGTRACRAVLQQYRIVWKWLSECFAAKPKQFFWRGIHNLPERWSKWEAAEANLLNKRKMKFPWKLFVSYHKNRHELMHTPGTLTLFSDIWEQENLQNIWNFLMYSRFMTWCFELIGSLSHVGKILS